ncbi:GLPGLI family protein [Hymenobacter arizonensis]|uniref:GLPGLI family protein n=1 Tax=Hymenobacter arizonensis TaxID=1227077 RepID=A0A1I6BEA8_HYMAR|nr:GLPGLI family protein [Hymenobacter arizonensis]SFQ79244.1 GLPGLI family protein [Hymenobacter arizonensis]
MTRYYCLLWMVTLLGSCATKNLPVRSNLTPTDTQGNLTFKYRISYKPDSLIPETSTEYSNLLVGEQFSRFETVGGRAQDSVRSLFPDVLTAENFSAQEFADKMLAIPRTKFYYTIFKRATTGRLYCYEKIGNARYTYIETDSTFKWQIGPEKMTVAGYACQRATVRFAGRAFEAWFTREIPISEGPYKFHGLPGLIVKINDTRQQYVFELVRAGKTATADLIVLPTKAARLVTKTEMRRGLALHNLQFASRMASMAAGEKSLSAAERERMLKPLNPLELQ